MNILQRILLLFLLCLASCNDSDTQRFDTSQNKLAVLLDSAQSKTAKKETREKYLDTLYIKLGAMPNDTVTRRYYRKTSAEYYNVEKYSKAITSARKTYGLAQKAQDTSTMARALYYSADSFYSQSNNDSAFYYYTQSEKLYRQLKDKSTLGEIILYKAYIYYDVGEYALCESQAIISLKMLLEENKSTHIYGAYNLIATALEGQSINGEALKYYQSALKQLDSFRQEGYSESEIAQFRASCYNNMGGVYEKMELHRQAINLYNDALKFADLEQENPTLYAKLLNNLAYAKFKSGNLEDLPQLFYKSLEIRKQLGIKSGIVASHMHLGEYFAFVKDSARSVDYFKLAYVQAKDIKSHFDILNSLKKLSEIDTKNRFLYSNRYIEVNDSLQDVAKLNRNNFARIEYETDKLENEKDALEKRNSYIIGISAVALLFIGAVFIIYYLNSRNKKLLMIQEQQKANEEIYQLMFEQQSKIDSARNEEKERIAMELHDGILNNIYAVRLNLEFINKKADDESILKRKEFIKELQNVETEIREVSHDLSRNAVFKEDKSFKNMLEFMISSQKNQFNTVFTAAVDENIDWDKMTNIFKVNIFRIIQESIQNINKYSQATEATISITLKGSSVRIAVSDNGIGFDPDKAKGGIGIKNLRKRASLINGELTINSRLNSGTAIEVAFTV